MIDWMHVGEIVLSNAFVAGVAWGAIRADVRAIKDRIGQCETDIRKADDRIDNVILNKGR